jgi:SAM-dependent methyltransferase
MNFIPNYDEVKDHYENLLALHGAKPQGVDWNSVNSQYLRFSQIIKVCNLSQEFTLLDYGCGYGGLVTYLNNLGASFFYTGYDVLERMIDTARQNFIDNPRCIFTTDFHTLPVSDYAVVSGTFNIKSEINQSAWTDFVIAELHKINDLSIKGFSFNLLTKYSDPEYMRADLYYADPCFFFDYCKTHFAKNVAVLHDYGLYDFTVLVRKQL